MNTNTFATKLLVPATTLLLVAGVAVAAGNMGFMAQAKKYDPGHTGQVLQAQWTGGIGQGDDHGLVLSMASTVAYPPGASADATIVGVSGHMLNFLAFDHKLGTACTGGSPRWNIETSAGGVYGFACASGTHVDLGNGWERITFSDADAQNLGGPAWPGFAAAPELTFLQVLQDEGGSTTLDNLSAGLDGSVFIFTKPGKTTAQ